MIYIRVIISGSRHCEDYFLLCRVIAESGFDITEVVSGGATGVDTMGEKWAGKKGIPVKRFDALWGTYGNAAGPIRNNKMLQYVGKEGALIAIQYPNSRGTSHMVEIARKAGIKMYVKQMRDEEPLEVS